MSPLIKNVSLAAWIVLVVAFLLLIVSRYASKGVKLWLGGLACFLGGVGLLYSLRGSFGLLVIVVAAYLSQAIPPRLAPVAPLTIANAKELAKGLVVGGLVAGGVFFDKRGNTFFQDLSSPELSPLTPVILVALTGATLLLLCSRRWDVKALNQSQNSALSYGPDVGISFKQRILGLVQFESVDLTILAFSLLILSIYDVLNKSLLSLLIIGLSAIYVFYRLSKLSIYQARFREGFHSRLKHAFVNKLIPSSLLVLIIFATANDLNSTYANEFQIVLRWPVAPLLYPLFIFASVAFTLTSVTLLFILLYPIIPFKEGYIKAVVYALILFLIFLLGLGTDSRLIASLQNILVGRLILYLSAPMLIGIYFDIHMQAAQQKISFRDASRKYFQGLQGIAAALGGILVLVAPVVYSFVTDHPFVTTYLPS